MNEQINHKQSLEKLANMGYTVKRLDGFVLVQNLPYVKEDKTIAHGDLISPWEGDHKVEPKDHKAYFKGGVPCNSNGKQLLNSIVNSPRPQKHTPSLHSDAMLSSKPVEGYRNLYRKLMTYINEITRHAMKIDPNETGKSHPREVQMNDQSVHVYENTAISRENLGVVDDKLSNHIIAIIGLGGTGSYILDLVSKTSVKKIILIDGDDLEQHNAFRAPGAVPMETFQQKESKAAYFHEVYSKIHKNIDYYAQYLSSENTKLLNVLDDIDFAFVCVDSGPSRKFIFECLNDRHISFVDVGMSVTIDDQNSELKGIIRTSLITPDDPSQESEIDLSSDEDKDALYRSNIQTADLNMLNAALAVITWKKSLRYYKFDDQKSSSNYLLRKNKIL